MTPQQLIQDWFRCWEQGDYLNVPIAEDFSHTSPFGTISGKQTYLDLVRENEAQFLGHSFTIHDALYEDNRACVRYSSSKGDDFTLDVSEWIYFSNNRIDAIYSYYHIGEIRQEQQLNSTD